MPDGGPSALNIFRRRFHPSPAIALEFPLTDLFREVEEDLRRERFQKLWDTYGLYVVGVAVAIVVVTAGVIGWRAWEKSRNEAASTTYNETVKSVVGADMSDADVAKAFAAFADKNTGGYAILARLREAAALLTSGDKAGAAKAYDMIAGDSSAPAMIAGLARIKSAMIAVDTAGYDDMNARLADLVADTSPWRANAHEILALSAFKAKKYVDANAHAQAVIDNQEASPGLRDRAHVLQAIVAPDLPSLADTIKVVPATAPATTGDTTQSAPAEKAGSATAE